jgi:hypothetical protein
MLSTFATLIIAAASINASDAQSLLESARAMQAERWAHVDNYTITLSVEVSGGLQTSVYYEKMEMEGQATFRMVSPTEYNRELTEQAGFPPGKEFMAEAAPGLDMMGEAMAKGGGDQPAMDLRGMTSQMSAFARAAGSMVEDDGRADAADAVSYFAEYTRRARLKGKESVRARSGDPAEMTDAYLLVADELADIKLDQAEGDSKFTLSRVRLWLDAEHLVPLRLLMEGEVESEGKMSPISIEKLDLDYKQVGPLYESHYQVYRLSGLMSNLSEKDRKDLEKAKAEFAKAKAELESMPKEQRVMVENMMRGQMEKFEAMMEGDAISTTTKVMSIAINEGPPTAGGPGTLTVDGPARADYPGAFTMAADDPNAELVIAARLPQGAEAIIGLKGAAPFPQSGQIEISGASGYVRIEGGADVAIQEGSGTITVTERTQTRIVGTFTALLTGDNSTESDGSTVTFSASGSFDTGAPVGPLKEIRGSPIPVDLFR